jgi:hypothetical protein
MRGVGLTTSITLLRVSIAGAATPAVTENIGAPSLHPYQQIVETSCTVRGVVIVIPKITAGRT